MKETSIDTETMWTLQNDDVLTANAASYVDDYLQANGSELFFDTALLCADAPYPDLYGARVDWELLLHREYELAMQTQQAGILPDVYTPPVIGRMSSPSFTRTDTC